MFFLWGEEGARAYGLVASPKVCFQAQRKQFDLQLSRAEKTRVEKNSLPRKPCWQQIIVEGAEERRWGLRTKAFALQATECQGWLPGLNSEQNEDFISNTKYALQEDWYCRPTIWRISVVMCWNIRGYSERKQLCFIPLYGIGDCEQNDGQQKVSMQWRLVTRSSAPFLQFVSLSCLSGKTDFLGPQGCVTFLASLVRRCRST